LIAGPHAAHPVRIFFDRELELGRLLQPIEEVGGTQVGRRAAADQDAVGAQPLEALDVVAAVGLAPGQIVVGRRESDMKDDHAFLHSDQRRASAGGAPAPRRPAARTARRPRSLASDAPCYCVTRWSCSSDSARALRLRASTFTWKPSAPSKRASP